MSGPEQRVNPILWEDLPSSLRGLGREELCNRALGEVGQGTGSPLLSSLWALRGVVENLLGQLRDGNDPEPIVLEGAYHRPIDLEHLSEIGVVVPQRGESLPHDTHFQRVAIGMVGLYDSQQAFLSKQQAGNLSQESGNS